jgi:hypothetical protein
VRVDKWFRSVHGSPVVSPRAPAPTALRAAETQKGVERGGLMARSLEGTRLQVDPAGAVASRRARIAGDHVSRQGDRNDCPGIDLARSSSWTSASRSALSTKVYTTL